MADRYLMDRQRDFEETFFQPVIASNEKMVQDIIKDLAPITEGSEEINRNIEMKETLRPQIGSKRRFVSGDCGPLAESFLRKYMDDVVDRSFGIRYENGHFMMADKILKIYGDNIMLDDEVYVGTPGLWTLIIDKSPKTYTKEDYERYKELLHETNAMYRDYDPQSSYQRNGIKFCDQYEKSRKDQYGKSRKDQYGKSRKDQYEKSRKDQYEKSRKDQYGKSRKDQYGKSRKDQYEKSRKDQYEKSRKDQYEKSRKDQYEKSRKDQYGKSRKDQYEKSRKDQYEKSRKDQYGKSRKDQYGKSRKDQYEKSRRGPI